MFFEMNPHGDALRTFFMQHTEAEMQGMFQSNILSKNNTAEIPSSVAEVCTSRPATPRMLRIECPRPAGAASPHR